MEGRQVDPLGAVYAEALAGLAESDGGRDALREVGERLSAFAEAWREDRTLRAYFLSADVRFSDKERAMEKLGAAQPNVLSRFLRLLLQRGRLTWFPQIADAYEAILDRTLGRIPVTLTTATPVPEGALEVWTEQIRSATGKEPVLRHVVKPQLIAGAILQVGDAILDGSTRRRIAEFTQQMKENAKHALQA